MIVKQHMFATMLCPILKTCYANVSMTLDVLHLFICCLMSLMKSAKKSLFQKRRFDLNDVFQFVDCNGSPVAANVSFADHKLVVLFIEHCRFDFTGNQEHSSHYCQKGKNQYFLKVSFELNLIIMRKIKHISSPG